MQHSRIVKLHQRVYWRNRYGVWHAGVVVGVGINCISVRHQMDADCYDFLTPTESTILLEEGEYTTTQPRAFCSNC